MSYVVQQERLHHLIEGRGQGKVIGLELDDKLLEQARDIAQRRGLEENVTFHKAEPNRIPFPDETFDALVSEFILFPTPQPTQIGQPEMARVLKPGGKMILTDVIVTEPIPQEVRDAFQKIGLDYLCEATPKDFQNWMAEAGLTEIEISDFTPLVRKVWERRQANDLLREHHHGYDVLLGHPEFGLGKSVFYIYVCGKKVG